MDYYYVNKNAQPNGDHEVHTTNCIFLPSVNNRLLLGYLAGCSEAVSEARKIYKQSNGCLYCCRACHTSQINQQWLSLHGINLISTGCVVNDFIDYFPVLPNVFSCTNFQFVLVRLEGKLRFSILKYNMESRSFVLEFS